MQKMASWMSRYVIPLLLLLAAFYGARRLVASRPEAQRQVPAARVVPVEITYPILTNYTVIVEAMGQVVPARRVEIRAQVGGRVERVHADFEIGGQLPAQAVLASIERADYEAALVAAESAYAQAQLAETLELQRQAIAREELLREGSLLPEGPGRAVALREPQVEAALRARAATEAAVAQARRNLDRSDLRVPFDAVVLQKMVDVGAIVAPQTVLGVVAAVDAFHIEAVVPPQSLGWLPRPQEDGVFEGKPTVRIGITHGHATIWRDGYLMRLAADMRGSMARLVAVVEEPLSFEHAPVLLDGLVALRIPGKTLSNVLAIPRRALREDGSVLLADAEDRLASCFPEVLHQTPDIVLIGAGLAPGARVITTALQAAVPGMSLRTGESGAAP